MRAASVFSTSFVPSAVPSLPFGRNDSLGAASCRSVYAAWYAAR